MLETPSLFPGLLQNSLTVLTPRLFPPGRGLRPPAAHGGERYPDAHESPGRSCAVHPGRPRARRTVDPGRGDAVGRVDSR